MGARLTSGDVNTLVATAVGSARFPETSLVGDVLLAYSVSFPWSRPDCSVERSERLPGLGRSCRVFSEVLGLIRPVSNGRDCSLSPVTTVWACCVSFTLFVVSSVVLRSLRPEADRLDELRAPVFGSPFSSDCWLSLRGPRPRPRPSGDRLALPFLFC